MQTITPKPEVAKRRDSVPVFSFVDIKIFFLVWCSMERSLPFFSLPCIQREKLRTGRKEVALYRRSKVEFEVYCVLACERSRIAGIYRGGHRSCNVQISRLKRDCWVRWRANRTQFVMPISFRKPTANLLWSSIVFIVFP